MNTQFFTLPQTGGRMAWREWGDAGNPRVLVCVHGLTRNSRDFDYLAKALSPHYRILCPDMPGRGESDWLADAKEYTYPNYVAYVTNWLEHVSVTKADWIGTSMGGIIGMFLAAERPALIGKLVLNDIGPFIPATGLKRIAGYAGKSIVFASRGEAEAALRMIFAPFGIKDEALWRHLFDTSLMEKDDRWQLAYDPAIGQAFADPDAIKDIDLWPLWDKIASPVLVLRGAESDILTAATVSYMQARKEVEATEIPNVGHAPTLMLPDEINPIQKFLLS